VGPAEEGGRGDLAVIREGGPTEKLVNSRVQAGVQVDKTGKDTYNPASAREGGRGYR